MEAVKNNKFGINITTGQNLNFNNEHKKVSIFERIIRKFKTFNRINNTEEVMKMEKKEMKNFNKRIDIRDYNYNYQYYRLSTYNR